MARRQRQGKSTPPKSRSEEEEIAVLQEILVLHGGQLENFDPVPPPSAVKGFLRRATLPELQGTLVELLTVMRNVCSSGSSHLCGG